MFRQNAESETAEERPSKKKVKRKKTANLGPCMKVFSVTKQDGGFKVECYLESIQKKMVTFEFQTSDLSTDEISSAFVSIFGFDDSLQTYHTIVSLRRSILAFCGSFTESLLRRRFWK